MFKLLFLNFFFILAAAVFAHEFHHDVHENDEEQCSRQGNGFFQNKTENCANYLEKAMSLRKCVRSLKMSHNGRKECKNKKSGANWRCHHKIEELETCGPADPTTILNLETFHVKAKVLLYWW
jgi:hypothetical protein